MITNTLFLTMRTLLTLLSSLLIIMSFLAIGKLISYLLGWSIPSSIIGLLLLFFCLSMRIISYESVAPAGHWLLKYMPLFFVPAGAALLNFSHIFAQHWLAIVVSSLVSTIIVLLCIGLSYQRLIR